MLVVAFDEARPAARRPGRDVPAARARMRLRAVTQFVGYHPAPAARPTTSTRTTRSSTSSRASGALHIAGESAPLRPGACVHLPARLVHSLENAGPGEMQVLGVFRPAGSPAEAYYPDGTAAAVPVS